jgi:hypothetical protein
MKTPRIRDFDPNAATTRELNSPLDHLPRIERPHPSEPTAPVAPTADGHTTNVVPGTAYQVPGTSSSLEQAVPTRRRIVRRRPFDIYEDQYETLKELAEAERIAGKEGGMSAIVRQGIDMYLNARGKKKP